MTPNTDQPVSFQVLFRDLVDLSGAGLQAALRDYHADLATATLELGPCPPETAPDATHSNLPAPAIMGAARWAHHEVKLLGFDTPMPANAVEGCLQPALMPPELKDDARAHGAHIVLYYAGEEGNPIEQRVAVGAVAGALTHFGAIVTLNEEARSALPSFTLLPEEPDEDMLNTLRTLPLPYFYGGFVKYEITDLPGVWMRTFACPRLGQPNLAFHAAAHTEGQHIFHLFTAVLGYLAESGFSFEPGETIRIDESNLMTVREATPTEWWLDSPDGPLWVLERVTEAKS